jgi:cobalt-zinc-cadmium resistance protein CzcA
VGSDTAVEAGDGVADVTSFGGETTQFQLVVDPAKLAQYNVSLTQVIAAIQANNANAGAALWYAGSRGMWCAELD